jgi:hypothetical protein
MVELREGAGADDVILSLHLKLDAIAGGIAS